MHLTKQYYGTRAVNTLTSGKHSRKNSAYSKFREIFRTCIPSFASTALAKWLAYQSQAVLCEILLPALQHILEALPDWHPKRLQGKSVDQVAAVELAEEYGTAQDTVRRRFGLLFKSCKSKTSGTIRGW